MIKMKNIDKGASHGQKCYLNEIRGIKAQTVI